MSGTPQPSEEPLVQLRDVTKHFNTSQGLFDSVTLSFDGGIPQLEREDSTVKAVENVSFDIFEGETLGLVGESGCGKSTLAKTVMRLIEPTGGTIMFEGDDLTDLSGEPLRQKRRDIQMVFQDPQSSLDPRMTVGDIIEEPMRVNQLYDAETRRTRTEDLLEKVGLDATYYNRFPHEFSGGQRQRVNLARALSVDPKFVVCDEPVSALDVSVQAQVLNVMKRLQKEMGLTYLFISHDLSVIRHISDRIAVMYLGRIVELGGTEEIFENPKHPYTRGLLRSIPVPDPDRALERENLEGDIPSPINPPSGCHFHPRCPALIPPNEYDIPDEDWQNILGFVRAVERRQFATSSEATLRDQFFESGIPAGDAGPIIREAIEAISQDSWDRATELLTDEFISKSVCVKRFDTYEVESGNGETRRVACHHYDDDLPSSSLKEL